MSISRFKILVLCFILLPVIRLSAQLTTMQNVPVVRSDSAFITDTYFPAVTLLYAQDDSGTMKMRCTATAFEKVDGGYLFVSAAHCATDKDGQKHEEIENAAFFVTPDENSGEKTFLRAATVACGHKDRSDDFCVFYVKTAQKFPVVSMGDDSTNMAGEEVVNVASPEGLGKQVFYGRITMAKLDRSVVIDDINWSHTVLLQLPGTNGGSSGSAIICLSQHAVCAFLVGIISDTTVVGIPVSRFKAFLHDVKTCEAKNYILDTNAAEDGFSYHCPSASEKKTLAK